MKFIRERRKGNFILAFALGVVFIACVIFIIKYYDMQARYDELLVKQNIAEPFKLR